MTIKLPERDPRMLIQTNLMKAVIEFEMEHGVQVVSVKIERTSSGTVANVYVETEETK
jgi:hypothetical protein